MLSEDTSVNICEKSASHGGALLPRIPWVMSFLLTPFLCLNFTEEDHLAYFDGCAQTIPSAGIPKRKNGFKQL